jgi:hypothetical protein
MGRVLATLLAKKLFIWLKKCSFEKTEVKFLGMVIQKGEVGISPDKVYCEGTATNDAEGSLMFPQNNELSP